jgi:hypothetical protein
MRALFRMRAARPLAQLLVRRVVDKFERLACIVPVHWLGVCAHVRIAAQHQRRRAAADAMRLLLPWPCFCPLHYIYSATRCSRPAARGERGKAVLKGQDRVQTPGAHEGGGGPPSSACLAFHCPRPSFPARTRCSALSCPPSRKAGRSRSKVCAWGGSPAREPAHLSLERAPCLHAPPHMPMTVSLSLRKRSVQVREAGGGNCPLRPRRRSARKGRCARWGWGRQR